MRISPKQAEQFKRQAQDGKHKIRAEAGKQFTSAEKKQLERFDQIIGDCDAVIRGDGRKTGK